MNSYLRQMIPLILIVFLGVYWITGTSSSYFAEIEDLIFNILITITIIILALIIGRYKNKYSLKKSIYYFVLPLLLITLLAYPIINGNNIGQWYSRYKLNQVQKLFSINLLQRTNLTDGENYTFTQYFLATDEKYIAFREGDNIIVKSRNNKITDRFNLTEDMAIFLNQRRYYKPKYSLIFKNSRAFVEDYIKIGDKRLKVSEEGKLIILE